MDPITEWQRAITRRQLFDRARNGVGAAALASLLPSAVLAAPGRPSTNGGGLPDVPHFAPRASKWFTFSSPAGPATSICSITSRIW